MTGNDERLTSPLTGVDYDAVGHRCLVCLSDHNFGRQEGTMATNGEWKVLVDILYCVA
jgi:hypothetical protein